MMQALKRSRRLVKEMVILILAMTLPSATLASPLLIDGERLEYEIRYLGLPAGKAYLEVKLTENGEHPTYRITSRAQSSSWVSVFFEVDDLVFAEVDAQTYEVIRFEKHLREGSYRKDIAVVYKPNGIIVFGDKVIRAQPGTRDVLSALYMVRGQDLKAGDELNIRTFDNGKTYSARVRVVGFERVSTKAGQFDCVIVQPEIEEGIFSKSGELLIWLTDDALRLPVLVKSSVGIGSFAAELISASFLGG